MKKLFVIIFLLKNLSFADQIGFNLNLGGLTSLTYEGRFFLGLNPTFSLVLSPSFQNTLELPWPHLTRRYSSVFAIRRLNLGAGIKMNFDGWYLEPMVRTGAFWAGSDQAMASIIPSILFGYTQIYDSGFMVSLGIGAEYEFLLGKKGYFTDFLKSAYYGITKLPITGEFSLGWMW